MSLTVNLISDDSASGEEDGPGPAVRSSTAAAPPAAPSTLLRKRKHNDAPPVVEEIVWPFDSDEEREKEKERLKALGKKRRKGKQKAGARDNGGEGSSKQGRKRHNPDSLDRGIKAVGEASELDDDQRVDVPDYLCERKREFDQGRLRLREAGLRLPPDYTGITFSDDDLDASGIEKRPWFGDSIKPSRANEDVEMEYSAGIIPAPIARYLRDYQITGAKCLHQMFVYQVGGILGDDMGLGKTVQVAAFLAAAFGKTGDVRDKRRLRKMRAAGRWYPKVLIVCPGSLLENWKQELTRWGWWNISFYHGKEKDDILQTAKSGFLEIMLTTYQTYTRHQEYVNTVEWDAVVADECHYLKDRGSAVTKAMNAVNALCRIGLTGTAIQNRYEELWTLLNWTNPGRFGTFAEWRTTICRPLALGQSHNANMRELSVARKTAKRLVHNLLPDYFLRRMKSLIADQLPKKTDKVVFCPMTDLQKQAYRNFINSEQVALIQGANDPCSCGSGKTSGRCCHISLEDGRTWYSLVFPSIITLQKLASHLTLLIPPSGEQGTKLKNAMDTLRTCLPDRCDELYRTRDSPITLSNPEYCGKWKVLGKLLRFWNDNGDKVLVFSHSVRLLKILRNLFNSTSYSVSYLDGSLGYEERQQAVDDFNSDPNAFVFLISTKAGGVGLNITSANKVIIFDPHWNPAYDLQAQDRAYRIGQSRDVDVFRLISAGTIEEIVYARQIYKQQQANIGYNASTERRYFKGVQQDKERKGELFGLQNIFSFRADEVVLREIVNKTNIAEAKVGVFLQDIDVDEAIRDQEESGIVVKKEPGTADDDEGGVGQLAKFLTAESKVKKEDAAIAQGEAARKGKSDAVQAILASAGVQYTHENSEVIGSSKVEAQLSRRAELAADDPKGHRALFADSQDIEAEQSPDQVYSEDERVTVKCEDGSGNVDVKGKGKAATSLSRRRSRLQLRYNPPQDVMVRQFCTMARDFGFASATEFALVVEGWTQEQRRNCLDTFYKQREAKLLSQADAPGKKPKKEEDDSRGETKTEMKDERGACGANSPPGIYIKPEPDDEPPGGVGAGPPSDPAGTVDIRTEVKGEPLDGPTPAANPRGMISDLDGDETEGDDDDMLDGETEGEESDHALVKDEEAAPAAGPRPGTGLKRTSSVFIMDDSDDDEL
ncbi:hypothetical protein RB595_007483 [Gaeumannomyces hyphopodioides]